MNEMDAHQLAAEFFQNVWPHLVWSLTLLITLVASGHAIMYKRDVRSAVAWVGLIWLVPVVGAALYAIMGINRIKRKARVLKADQPGFSVPLDLSLSPPVDLKKTLPGQEQFHALSRLVAEVVQKPLLGGNRVTPLVNGSAAYGAMLSAIEGARESVALCTYIFDNDDAGRTFLGALTRAVKRGAEVRVLIDDMGARYSLISMPRELRKAGVPVARFLPTLLPRRLPFVNLRNHRKILVVDGKTGFTGGMNIRQGHIVNSDPRHPVQDIHFRVEGPVVAHLQEAFAGDWFFTTAERLEGESWFPRLGPRGPVVARGIADGPDEDFEKLPWTVHGALACAKSSVRVMTPYFLPDGALITALNTAAMRGVEVDILLPEENNLPMVKWASTHQLWQVLEHGCRVWMTPPPFDHSKLMLVDGAWMLFGSGNWDPRSFVLNFEFNVECYDRDLAAELEGIVNEKLRKARRVTLGDVDGRSFPVKLRDGAARLFAPYL